MLKNDEATTGTGGATTGTGGATTGTGEARPATELNSGFWFSGRNVVFAGIVLLLVGGALGFAATGVVKYRTTREFWDLFGQPLATAAAGLFAVFAATLALIGVFITQRTTMYTTHMQLDHQGEALKQQERLEREKHERQAKLDAQLSASSAISALAAAATAADRAVGAYATDPISKMVKRSQVTSRPPDYVTSALRAGREASDACLAAAVGLLIVGDTKAYQDTSAYAGAVTDWLVEVEHKPRYIGGVQQKHHEGLRNTAIATIAGASLAAVESRPE